MTFSANKIGTIAEVKEHLRDHHGSNEASDRLRSDVVKAAIAEVYLLEEAGFTAASVSISGHSFHYAEQPNTNMGVSYTISVQSVHPDDLPTAAEEAP